MSGYSFIKEAKQRNKWILRELSMNNFLKEGMRNKKIAVNKWQTGSYTCKEENFKCSVFKETHKPVSHFMFRLKEKERYKHL